MAIGVLILSAALSYGWSIGCLLARISPLVLLCPLNSCLYAQDCARLAYQSRLIEERLLTHERITYISKVTFNSLHGPYAMFWTSSAPSGKLSQS